jgi:hypothetical protein
LQPDIDAAEARRGDGCDAYGCTMDGLHG